MPDNVTFNLIPSNLYVPGVFFEINPIRKGLLKVRSNNLIIGQRLATGTLAAETLAPVTSASEAAKLCGKGSIGHLMAAASLQAAPFGDHRILMLDDAVGSSAATGSIVFAGTSTAAGTVALFVAGQYVPVNISSSAAAAAVASAVVAAIALQPGLPMTAAVDGVDDKQVNFTARNKGTLGNGLDIRLNYQVGQELPAGITATINAMSGGAGDPDITDAIAVFAEQYFAAIAMPWTDTTNLAALEAEMTSRFGPMAQIAGHVYTALNNTYADALTWSGSRNSAHVSTLPMNGSPTPTFVIAATLAAVCERERANDPARQMTTVELPGVLPPVAGKRFIDAERNLLAQNGLSTYTVTRDDKVLLETVVTNYQTDAFGNDDESYLYVETKWAVDYFRMACVDRVYKKFMSRRMKLANDGVQIEAGQLVATPKDIRNELIACGYELEKVGIIEQWGTYSKQMLVVRSEADKERINAIVPPNIINNFRRFAGAVNYEV